MDCPACDSPLVVVERDGIELDWCLSCRGLWFDEGELEILAQKSGRRLEVSDLGRPTAGEPAGRGRKCPRCRRRMETIQAGGDEPVTVERCPRHGLWFDHGELGRIMSRLELIEGEGERTIVRFLGETFRSQVERS